MLYYVWKLLPENELLLVSFLIAVYFTAPGLFGLLLRSLLGA